jgi:hypothetical protein
MSKTDDAGDTARSECTPISKPPSSTPSISPAARKFAEYLARRMAPTIEYAAKQQHHASGADALQRDKQ